MIVFVSYYGSIEIHYFHRGKEEVCLGVLVVILMTPVCIWLYGVACSVLFGGKYDVCF